MEVERVLTVNMLKPYYIKADENHIRVILAYKYFSIFIKGEVYQFIPIEEKEIRLHRKTREIVNLNAEFAFQRGKKIVRIAMSELVSLPNFLTLLHSIVEDFYQKNNLVDEEKMPSENESVIQELERLNLYRLIDKALDEHDEELFNKLTKLL